MRVGFHSAVQNDVRRVLRRYDKESRRLGDEFWAELNRYFEVVAGNPFRFHIFIGDLRRVLPDRITVIAVRHHKQNPRFGLKRR
jgi:hypothetical protein